MNLDKKYFRKYFWRKPSKWKFCELSMSNNTTILNNLTAYLLHAFKIRNKDINMSLWVINFKESSSD